jgi:hypothetical protein
MSGMVHLLYWTDMIKKHKYEILVKKRTGLGKFLLHGKY